MDEPTQIGKLLPMAGQWENRSRGRAIAARVAGPGSAEEIIMALLPCLTIAAPSGVER